MPQSKPTIPNSIGELMDHLSMMMLKSPSFKDDYFANVDVDMVFFELNEGLKFVQKKLNDERYQKLRALSDCHIRACADWFSSFCHKIPQKFHLFRQKGFLLAAGTNCAIFAAQNGPSMDMG